MDVVQQRFGEHDIKLIINNCIILDNRIRAARKLLKRHADKDDSWWWETGGLMPEEVKSLKAEKWNS